MKLLSIIFILVFISACGNTAPQNDNQNTSAMSSPSPKPTLSKEEAEEVEKRESADKQKAINDFIAQNYKGWKLEGVASDSFSDDCEDRAPCDLHLTNGSQNKIITVILKQFLKSNGAKYWFVREAKQIDLTKAKIDLIKDGEKGLVLETLTINDISDNLKNEIIQQDQETQTANVDYQ